MYRSNTDNTLDFLCWLFGFPCTWCGSWIHTWRINVRVLQGPGDIFLIFRKLKLSDVDVWWQGDDINDKLCMCACKCTCRYLWALILISSVLGMVIWLITRGKSKEEEGERSIKENERESEGNREGQIQTDRQDGDGCMDVDDFDHDYMQLNMHTHDHDVVSINYIVMQPQKTSTLVTTYEKRTIIIKLISLLLLSCCVFKLDVMLG